MIEFPKNFLWGAATSAYQVEGDNQNSDWWEWEEQGKSQEQSAQACRHYQLYEEDFKTASLLSHNAHRISIEWSRIQPEEQQFSTKEIEHYINVILSLKKNNLEPIITLHHFTLPIWLKNKGGWLNQDTISYFSRYVEKVVSELSQYVRYWITINEPLVYVYNAYLLGIWPPQEKSFLKARKASDNLTAAHLEAYKVIKKIYSKKNLGFPSVSLAKHLRGFIPVGNNPCHRLRALVKDYLFNFRLLNKLIRLKALDFIGINYYTAEFHPENNTRSGGLKKNNLGWPIYPAGLFDLLLRLKRYNLSIFILENGISTDDDQLRWSFIESHIRSLYRAMQRGVKVTGYLYWSLLDNYEWDKGFAPRFGLVKVDYSNCKRTIRRSAEKFAHLCKTGRL